MSLQEQKNLMSVKLLSNGIIEGCWEIIITKNNAELSRTVFRDTFPPGRDLSEADTQIQQIAEIAWTPEIIENYERKIAEMRGV